MSTREEMVAEAMRGDNESLWMRISEALGFPADGFTHEQALEVVKDIPAEELPLYER